MVASTREVEDFDLLEARLRAKEAELARALETQRTLAEISAQIASIHDSEGVLLRTVEEAQRLLRADSADIKLVDPSHQTLSTPVAFAPNTMQLDQVAVPVGYGVSGLAMAEGRVAKTDDYLHDATFRHLPDLDARVRRHAIRSIISAPLASAEGILGVLDVHSAREAAFTDGDAELLGLLADQAAIAISNSRLYELVQSSERRYRFLVDNSPDLIWSCDAAGAFTFLSEGVERLTGYRAEDAVGRHWTLLTAPEHVAVVEESWDAMRAEPTIEQHLRIRVPRKDGTQVAVEIHAMPIVKDGAFAGAHGTVRDVTERDRLETDLRRKAAELAAAEERGHLARELHDSVTQALFSMGLTIRTLELALESAPDLARTKLEELRDLQHEALTEMRTLILELRPPSLEQGLVQAIASHAGALAARTGLGVTVAPDAIGRLPSSVEEALYRITQEALHNVVKHARATAAQVTLTRESAAVRLRVADDGQGFDTARVDADRLGLAGMKQRAGQIGATLSVRSRPGNGTEIDVYVPATAL